MLQNIGFFGVLKNTLSKILLIDQRTIKRVLFFRLFDNILSSNELVYVLIAQSWKCSIFLLAVATILHKTNVLGWLP